MDKEKLEKAAFDFMLGATYPESACGYLREVFESGAEWLQSQPLADRLTEEERERIKGWYNKALQEKGDTGTLDGAMKTTVSSVVMFCLSDIFGKEMFEKQNRYAVVNPAFFGR